MKGYLGFRDVPGLQPIVLYLFQIGFRACAFHPYKTSMGYNSSIFFMTECNY